MDHENTGLFERFDDSPGARDSRSLPGELSVRPATPEDADAVGRISSEREEGVASEHSQGFLRELGSTMAQGSSMVFVAEAGGEVVGFGRVRYFGEELEAAVGDAPAGWYLTGVVVDPRCRRCGVGGLLTSRRLEWISERSGCAYYFANSRNRVSIALHERFGFTEVARGPEFCGVSFTGGEGILFELDLLRITSWKQETS